MYLLSGVLTSSVHVLSGPDHLAAVMPTTLASKNRGWHIGLSWGLGHISGMALIGMLMALFGETLAIQSISASSELLVGFILIGVALWGIRQAAYKDKKKTPEPHDGNVRFGAFGIGALHGFAGIAHFVLLLPVVGLQNPSDSLFYMLGFAIGTIASMTAFSLLLAVAYKRSLRSGVQNLADILRYGSSLFAFVVGIYWIYEGL